ncbi:MAG: AraC family transcriptional regulator [Hyphomonadaceae bacterium]|nr:AraC family transcriptional regulator [Hyphomonadaceae bacterium]
MDLIDDIMRTLDLKGSLYFRTHFTAPWAVTVPDYAQVARFHLVVQGTCYVAVEGQDPICLGPGDMALISKGREHVLSAEGATQAAPLETVLDDAGYDGNGVLVVGDGAPNAATQMVCGHFNFRPQADHPLLSSLPDLVHLRVADRSATPWLDDTLRLITRRMFAGELGASATITRLSEIVFIEILRSNLVESEALHRVVAGMSDRQIGQALSAMHNDPGASWTLENLAQLVGMSRSRFSDRFTHLMGVSAMAYLTSWRLQKSLELLDQNQFSIQEVSNRAGYQSAAAFSRAFSSRFDLSPKAYRAQMAI